MLLAPVKAAMLAVTFLVAVDFLTGVWAARKRAERIQSAKMARTVSKTVIYQLAIICALVTEKYLLDIVPVVKTMLGFIAAVELLSAYENMSVISGIPLKDALMRLLNKKEPDKPEE